MNIWTNGLVVCCPYCDKEANIEWTSFFDKVVGRSPHFCPWCGKELKVKEHKDETLET